MVGAQSRNLAGTGRKVVGTMLLSPNKDQIKILISSSVAKVGKRRLASGSMAKERVAPQVLQVRTAAAGKLKMVKSGKKVGGNSHRLLCGETVQHRCILKVMLDLGLALVDHLVAHKEL